MLIYMRDAKDNSGDIVVELIPDYYGQKPVHYARFKTPEAAEGFALAQPGELMLERIFIL